MPRPRYSVISDTAVAKVFQKVKADLTAAMESGEMDIDGDYGECDECPHGGCCIVVPLDTGEPEE